MKKLFSFYIQPFFEGITLTYIFFHYSIVKYYRNLSFKKWPPFIDFFAFIFNLLKKTNCNGTTILTLFKKKKNSQQIIKYRFISTSSNKVEVILLKPQTLTYNRSPPHPFTFYRKCDGLPNCSHWDITDTICINISECSPVAIRSRSKCNANFINHNWFWFRYTYLPNSASSHVGDEKVGRLFQANVYIWIVSFALSYKIKFWNKYIFGPLQILK